MGAFESRVDSSETIDLLKGLVGIKSVNPSLVHGAPVEAEIAEHVEGVHEGHRHGVVGRGSGVWAVQRIRRPRGHW